MRSIGIIAAVVLGLAGQAHAQTLSGPDVTVLPEVAVSGRTTREAVQDFVGRVAAPSSDGASRAGAGNCAPVWPISTAKPLRPSSTV